MADSDPTASIGPGPGPGAPGLPGLIGLYHVLGVLGDGGFGVVYEAEQREPVRRRVAIKVIKPGMDSEAVIARFEAERQALAVMDHPCIAKIFDGGLTGPELGSRPYFVMEIVRGVPITEHCDTQQLTIDERCELFIKVCEAVQHAHTKGVVHRDLKPSNVLVAYDAEGKASPRVIDFGVAKALNTRLTEKTIFTERGQLIGTPEYMSPEQAEMSGQDIDTRADVYSLGVLLYELLTGVLPFDPKTLREAAFAEIQRIIRETDPPKPSTRLSTMMHASDSAERVREIVKARKADARSITGVLKRDLDWVVMRSLEKDRNRRYQSGVALAGDLRRYLGGDAVEAGPPSASYRLTKFVSRHRVPVVAALTLLVTTTAAAGVSLAMYVKSDRALGREQAALSRARQQSEQLRGALDQIQSYVSLEESRLLEIAGETFQLSESGLDVQLFADSRVLPESPLSAPRAITVHHTGISFADPSLEAVMENMIDVRRAHVMDIGFRDIAYHLIIDPAGRIWSGRSLLEQGAHIIDENEGNIAVLVLGDFDEHAVTAETTESLFVALDRLLLLTGLKAEQVYTHREWRSSKCPGAALQAVVNDYRRRRGVPDAVHGLNDSYRAASRITPAALVSGVYLEFDGDDWSVGFKTIESELQSPYVGTISVQLVDSDGEPVRGAVTRALLVALPHTSRIYPLLGSAASREKLVESLGPKSVSMDLPSVTLAPLREWMMTSKLAAPQHADLQTIVNDGGVAIVTIEPDRSLIQMLDDNEIYDRRAPRDENVYSTRLPVTFRGDATDSQITPP